MALKIEVVSHGPGYLVLNHQPRQFPFLSPSLEKIGH